jgi:hypothetical protein
VSSRCDPTNGALNEQRASRQSALDKLGNGLVKLGTSAFTGAAESTVVCIWSNKCYSKSRC